ncbi:hypothetical protein EUTSA_v10016069mg [Eutrema salsugineum]|uniref:Prolamin-like domain-containing protein n=1 Tax=Eutrema salsugineum TaxID=72664 RepID=V4KYQ0_EUTSA|nr:uncharacterized protein LOC18016979 [Eutrema salsugineum]ESQ43100.1 hypothetical protein EUTSA_v10016069mg [Eutrema salsugineum]
MEGRIQALLSTILVMTLCATTFVKPGLAQLPTIPGSPIDLTKCFSTLFNVEGCVMEIYKFVLTGKFENIRAMCCKAFMEVDAKCWPQMFPLNPLFPPILKDGCSRIN